MTNSDSGLIGVLCALALALIAIPLAVAASTPKELVLRFGDCLVIEYRQF